nr:MAG TPA: major tail protein [Caudoviricetes sp.]
MAIKKRESRIIGLCDIHVATFTNADQEGGNTEPEYGTPEWLAGAVSANVTKESSAQDFYEDDELTDTIDAMGKITVEMVVSALSLAGRAKLQGSTVKNGVLVEKESDEAPYVALGFKSKKLNGKYRYVWLLKGKFSRVNDSYQQKTNSITSSEPSLSGSFMSRKYDGVHQIIADEDDESIKPEVLTGWFTAVPNPADLHSTSTGA